jgi:hypothetical protein
MSATSVFLAANPAVAAPVAASTDDPSVSPPGTQADGQPSFARIMSNATADDTNDASSSSPTPVPGSKSDKDGKRESDKTPVQVMAQIAASIVPPQTSLPAPIVLTVKPSGGAAAGAAPVCVEANPTTVRGTLGEPTISNDKAAVNGSRNLTNTKQSAIQSSANDPKTSSTPDKGSTQEAQSSGISSQPSVVEPLPSPSANPAVVENAAQPALAADSGTAIAKQVGRMKMQDKTENNSEVAEKNLPPTSLVAQTEATGDGAKPRAISANLPQREGRNSTTSDSSTPILAGLVQGKAQPSITNTGADAVRSPQVDKAFTEISERVMSFKRVGADSAEVNLRPDNNTEITLSLSLRNGQVEMTARLERGNLSALNSHWTGLQQSLSQQGVRVGQLTSSQSAMNDQLPSGNPQQGPGENTSHSFEQGTEGLNDLSVAAPVMTETLKGRSQKALATSGRGWEMWA